jgi:hypothetical protein
MTVAARQQPRHPDPPALADGFHPHGIREPVTVKGAVIPGLRASFYRRAVGGRTETVGLYALEGREVFAAWGWVGEAHCRYNAVRRDGGGWYPTRRGCPVLRPLWEHGQVRGLGVMAGRMLLPFVLGTPSRPQRNG